VVGVFTSPFEKGGMREQEGSCVWRAVGLFTSPFEKGGMRGISFFMPLARFSWCVVAGSYMLIWSFGNPPQPSFSKGGSKRAFAFGGRLGSSPPPLKKGE